VLEAKGEKSAEGFEHMEIQTAFPIKNALQLQYDLLKTRGNTMDVPGGPLVWFLANKGEDWRVYAAIVYEEEGRPNYVSACTPAFGLNLTCISGSIISGAEA